jgi:dihydroorotate dehydrogenase (fumarate)/dihydroorotate dehydrogenase
VSLYTAALRPLLFRLPADRAHALGQAALRWPLPWRLMRAPDPGLPVRYAGVALPGPVGLAAGFDKDAELLPALSCLGFGCITVGSIMVVPRFGNPFPRLVRYPESESLADSMGLPSQGLERVVRRLAAWRVRPVPVFANVAGFSAEDIVIGVRAVAPLVDGVEINLLCPNIAPGERFDEVGYLAEVLDRLGPFTHPLTTRVPNDTVAEPDRLAAFIEACVAGGIGGVRVGGGRALAEPRLGTGTGTLHGRAIFYRALAHVALAARLAAGRLSVKGNGGVSSAADVRAMLAAGACCVDLYSAFVYQGWGVARDIHAELRK